MVDIAAGSSITIETKGADEAWLRLRTSADATYVLRTLSFNSESGDAAPEIDTVIDVFDPTERNPPLFSDDDGGQVENGERWSSLLSIARNQAAIYHIRIQNIDQGHGTFVLTVIEKPLLGGDPGTSL
jgi:hypothetical protein